MIFLRLEHGIGTFAMRCEARVREGQDNPKLVLIVQGDGGVLAF